MNNTAEILDLGINCLIEQLGVVNAELFISTLVRERSDYTKWRQRYFDHISPDEFHQAAIEYGKTHSLFS